MGKYYFLFLSLLSGMIELGSIIFGINMGYSVLQIIGLGLAYQIGNLVPNPFKLNKTSTTVVSILSTGCFGAALFTKQYLIMCLGFIFIAMTVQSLRTSYKSKVHTALKRSSRIVGFFLAPLAFVPVIFGISITLVFGAIFSKYNNDKVEFVKPKLKYIHLIMLMQQMHYFCYCYFIILLINKFSIANNVFISSSIFISICFALSWVTYTWIPLILNKNTYTKYYILTHIYLLAVLLLMGLYPQSVMMIVLWILTGFGGGTGYCIEKIDLLDKAANSNDMVFIGNIGHILGVIAGMVTYYIFGTENSTIFLGAIFTVLATTMIAHYHFKYLKSPSSSNTAQM